MATLRAGYVFWCVLALTAAGCEMVREEGRRAARSTNPASTEEAPPPAIETSPESVPPTMPSTSRTPFVPDTSKAKSTDPKKTDPKTTAPKTTEPKKELAGLETRQLQGKVRGVDVQRRLISVMVGTKSETFPVDTTAFIEDLADESHALKGGLAGIRPGATAFLAVYKNKNNKEVVSLIRVKNPAK